MEATPRAGAAAWGPPLGALGAANAAGHLPDLYARFWRFDRILHACTIFAVTFRLALFARRRALRGGNGALLAPMIAGVGLAIGALREVAGWGFDRIAPGDGIKGKNDTIVGIVMDTFGALGAGFAALAFLRPEPRSTAAPEAP